MYILVFYRYETTIIGSLEDVCNKMKDVMDDHGESIFDDGDYFFVNTEEPDVELYIWDYIETYYAPKEK